MELSLDRVFSVTTQRHHFQLCQEERKRRWELELGSGVLPGGGVYVLQSADALNVTDT